MAKRQTAYMIIVGSEAKIVYCFFKNSRDLLSFLFLFRFRHEAGHEAVGDGGADPDFREHICGVLIGGFQVDVQVVERGNDHVDDADGPQVALGVALPVLASIEVGERA